MNHREAAAKALKTATKVMSRSLGQLSPPSARESGALPPMICRMIFDELCVLANGDVVCSCGDPSGIRVYGNVFHDRIADIYNGAKYVEMRTWQLNAKADSFCPVIQACCGGRVSRATSADGTTGRVVRMLQLEPISFCNLRCPACPVTQFHIDPGYRDDRASILPLEVMLDVVDQLPELEKILFYNFGEPFLHKHAIAFLRQVRSRRPDVILHTSTNGLMLRDGAIDAIASEVLADRILFSIDGAYDESYRKYRVNGSLDQALSKMSGLVAACERFGTRNRVDIIWQYILFEWNDSDEELARARRLASKLGVPLKWVFTHTTGASKRFTDGSELAAQLFSKGDPYSALTCDSRMLHLWKHRGVAAGRYLAQLSLDREVLAGPAGTRVAAMLTVENLSSSAWSPDSGHLFRIGLLLRSDNGRVLEELPGVPLPLETIPPGGKENVLVDLRLPASPGTYQLFIDVVEDGVCWFSERSSAPLVCNLRVEEGSGNQEWDYKNLVETIYDALLGRPPDASGCQYWRSLLSEGGPLELILSSFAAAASSDERDSALRKRPAARAALLSVIDAAS
jgi:molybdenum cofactor biosynthesis enzyme MoaA